MKIGDRCFVHGYIDEIRKDTVIIKNNGGYFGTDPGEVITVYDTVHPNWIPCSERLPEDEGEYLVSFDDGFIATTGYYEGDFELWADAGEPLAWQPLPEAYREEK